MRNHTQGLRVRSTLRDAAHDITYHVLAFRPLDPEEVKACIAIYLRQRRSRIPRRSVVTISTILGFGGR